MLTTASNNSREFVAAQLLATPGVKITVFSESPEKAGSFIGDVAQLMESKSPEATKRIVKRTDEMLCVCHPEKVDMGKTALDESDTSRMVCFPEIAQTKEEVKVSESDVQAVLDAISAQGWPMSAEQQRVRQEMTDGTAKLLFNDEQRPPESPVQEHASEEATPDLPTEHTPASTIGIPVKELRELEARTGMDWDWDSHNGFTLSEQVSMRGTHFSGPAHSVERAELERAMFSDIQQRSVKRYDSKNQCWVELGQWLHGRRQRR